MRGTGGAARSRGSRRGEVESSRVPGVGAASRRYPRTAKWARASQNLQFDCI